MGMTPSLSRAPRRLFDSDSGSRELLMEREAATRVSPALPPGAVSSASVFPWSISSLRSSAASPDGRSPSSAVASAWGVFSSLRRHWSSLAVAERDARRRAHGFTELIEQLLCQFVRFANDVSVLFELRLGVRERFFERRRLGDDVRHARVAIRRRSRVRSSASQSLPRVAPRLPRARSRASPWTRSSRRVSSPILRRGGGVFHHALRLVEFVLRLDGAFLRRRELSLQFVDDFRVVRLVALFPSFVDRLSLERLFQFLHASTQRLVRLVRFAQRLGVGAVDARARFEFDPSSRPSPTLAPGDRFFNCNGVGAPFNSAHVDRGGVPSGLSSNLYSK